MSKVRKVERVINVSGTGILPEGDRMQVHNIQVRRGVPLPDLGARVVVMDDHRIVKFAGEVINLDFEKHTYDVELRKSLPPVLNEVRRVV